MRQGLILDPVSGALMHNDSSVLVGLNAALLLKGDKEEKDTQEVFGLDKVRQIA